MGYTTVDNQVLVKGNDIADTYGALHRQICSILEQADGKGTFAQHSWKKDIGSGLTCVMEKGAVIEKGGVNFSHVSGPVTAQLAKQFKEKATHFTATGISSILHSNHPFIPTIHMNVRYFALDNGSEWFGGGIDLTPSYVDPGEVTMFHKNLKAVCDAYDPFFYTRFKQWADDYFFLEHRNETRGVGGIFFDHQKPGRQFGFYDWLCFTSDLAKLYPLLFAELADNNRHKPFSDVQKKWQKLRRGRYVEFNLLYDRGTRFGVESNGNIESILISMPPEVDWHFNIQPNLGSDEEKTLGYLKKGIEWIV